MAKWFMASMAFTSIMGRAQIDVISDAMGDAEARINSAADGRWIDAVSDYTARFGDPGYLVAVEVSRETDKIRKRFNPRGITNYSLRIPLSELEGMSADAMSVFFTQSFQACCDDSAKRWGVSIAWRAGYL